MEYLYTVRIDINEINIITSPCLLSVNCLMCAGCNTCKLVFIRTQDMATVLEDSSKSYWKCTKCNQAGSIKVDYADKRFTYSDFILIPNATFFVIASMKDAHGYYQHYDYKLDKNLES